MAVKETEIATTDSPVSTVTLGAAPSLSDTQCRWQYILRNHYLKNLRNHKKTGLCASDEGREYKPFQAKACWRGTGGFCLAGAWLILENILQNAQYMIGGVAPIP